MVQTLLFMMPSDAPISYGIAILTLMFFALFSVLFFLVIKVPSRDASPVRRDVQNPREAEPAGSDKGD